MAKEKKYIALSFDDASMDYYNICYPFFTKNNIPSTLFVITGTVNGDCKENFNTMSLEQIKDISLSPLTEIASHGHYHNHNQKYDDIKKSINLIKEWVNEYEVGYATPYETLPPKEAISNKSNPLYIRIGERYRKHPICFFYRYKFNKAHNIKWLIKIHSKFGNGKKEIKKKILYSIQIRNSFSPQQVFEIIEKCKNNKLIILQFHTIIKDDKADVSTDRFPFGVWSLNNLNELLNLISDKAKYELTNIKEGIKKYE